MGRWQVRSGLILGLVLAVATGWTGRSSRTAGMPPPGALLPDCAGRLRVIVIQYVAGAAEIAGTPYREFLRQLPAEVTVRVLCPGARDWEDFRQRIGPVRCELEPVFAGHAMTCWSRDRWLCLAGKGPAAPALLVAARAEDAAAAWPAREGDQQIALDIVHAAGDRLRFRRSARLFDGGDFVADEELVVVTPRVAERNPHLSRAEIRARLEALCGRPVLLLEQAPPHHAGMFLMLAGKRTALVGDPSLARALVDAGTAMPVPPDFSAATQAAFDAVAAACTGRGCRVVRMPVVAGADGRTYLTPLNAILEERDGQRLVYMPVYRGWERLNREATRIWQAVGYVVRPVDCTSAYPCFGSLRCLVNVLAREADGASGL